MVHAPLRTVECNLMGSLGPGTLIEIFPKFFTVVRKVMTISIKHPPFQQVRSEESYVSNHEMIPKYCRSRYTTGGRRLGSSCAAARPGRQRHACVATPRAEVARAGRGRPPGSSGAARASPRGYSYRLGIPVESGSLLVGAGDCCWRRLCVGKRGGRGQWRSR